MPAFFEPIVRKVIQSMTIIDQDNYYILLILTPGQIADIENTENVRYIEKFHLKINKGTN